MSIGGTNLRRTDQGDSLTQKAAIHSRIDPDGESIQFENHISSFGDAMPAIVAGKDRVIAGNVLFFSSVLVEQLVLNPWSQRVVTGFNSSKT